MPPAVNLDNNANSVVEHQQEVHALSNKYRVRAALRCRSRVIVQVHLRD